MLSQWPSFTKKKEKKEKDREKVFKRDVHDVQCNMEMMTVPMILVMEASNVNRTKTVCSFCMNCMRNYVQQEANCIAVPVRKKKKNFFFSFSFL